MLPHGWVTFILSGPGFLEQSGALCCYLTIRSRSHVFILDLREHFRRYLLKFKGTAAPDGQVPQWENIALQSLGTNLRLCLPMDAPERAQASLSALTRSRDASYSQLTVSMDDLVAIYSRPEQRNRVCNEC